MTEKDVRDMAKHDNTLNIHAIAGFMVWSLDRRDETDTVTLRF